MMRKGKLESIDSFKNVIPDLPEKLMIKNLKYHHRLIQKIGRVEITGSEFFFDDFDEGERDPSLGWTNN